MQRLPRARLAVVGLVCAVVAATGHQVALACTAFCAVGGGQVLVGNNEDWYNPHTKIRFVPATPGSHGRVYVGFDDLIPQGGMNERGLWFDGFAAPSVGAGPSSELPHFQGNIVDVAMAECATVEDVIRLFSQYNRASLSEGILMFADASGDAVSIERNAIVRKTGRHFVQTNFHQSLASNPDSRFVTANSMLEQAGNAISIDLFRKILAATRQKGAYPTLYSNIYELRSRTLHLYHFQDFERVVTFDLAEELKKGERVLDIPALFPPNAEAEAFAARRRAETAPPGPTATVAPAAVVALLVALGLYGAIRGGRRVRIGLAAIGGVIVAILAAAAIILSVYSSASGRWIQFSIGPASGESAHIGPNTINSSGMTLKAALATAYDIPAVRVIGPPWLAQTRYAIQATVGSETPETFRPLLQEELKNRLHLETHLEARPFDVLVLTASDTPRVERAAGQRPAIWIQKAKAQFQEATMKEVASGLQGILGKPVIDETGLTGTFNLEFGWEGERVASVTTTLRDRFGLRLTPATREMEALVVDRVRRDPSLVLLGEIGRVTRAAPSHLREQISNAVRVH